MSNTGKEMNKHEECSVICKKVTVSGTLKVELVPATLAEANEKYVKELKDAGKLMNAEEVKEMDLLYKDWSPYDDPPGDTL